MRNQARMRRWGIFMILFLVMTSGCTAWKIGWNAGDYEGRVLPVDGAGGDRLKTEMDYDKHVRSVVKEKGRPDYIQVFSEDRIQLYYVDRNEVVDCRRGTLSEESAVTTRKGIPRNVSRHFRLADQKKLEN